MRLKFQESEMQVQDVLYWIARAYAKDHWPRLNSEIRHQKYSLNKALPIEPVLVECLVLAEDRRYGKHYGFDPLAICRAIWRRLTTRKREGASTIAQQLVRTITNNRDATFARKVLEIMLSVIVTREFDAEDISRIYLNVAYYGWRMNNLPEACERLHLNRSKMSLSQAASLIARLKYPEPQCASSNREMQIGIRKCHIIDLWRIRNLTNEFNVIQISVLNETR